VSEGETQTVADMGNGDMEGVEEEGEPQAKVQRRGVGVRGKW
jgi:hypothetical protein